MIVAFFQILCQKPRYFQTFQLFFNRFWNVRFSERCNSIATFLLEKNQHSFFQFFSLTTWKWVFLINLRNITVTWIFKMATFMWVIFNCLCVENFSCLMIAYAWYVHPHEVSKVHQLHEFAICISSQGGNERWQLMSKLVQFTDVHFLDLNSDSYDNLNSMKLDLHVTTKVKFSANGQSL